MPVKPIEELVKDLEETLAATEQFLRDEEKFSLDCNFELGGIT